MENQAREIRLDQKEELSVIRSERDSYIRDRLGNADEAAELLRLLQEAGSFIDEYIISDGDELMEDSMYAVMDQIRILTGELESRFNEPENLAQISLFRLEILHSRLIFYHFVEATEQQKHSENLLVQNGEEVLETNQLFQTEMEEQMQ